MKFELKKLTHNTRLSEETPAYAADLWVDGVKVASVRNEGRGGADRVTFYPGKREIEPKITAYFASLPNIPCADFEDGLEQSLEFWCHREVSLQGLMKTYKRMVKTKIVLFHNGNELAYKAPPTALTPENRAKIEARYPGSIIVNDLDDGAMRDELVKQIDAA